MRRDQFQAKRKQAILAAVLAVPGLPSVVWAGANDFTFVVLPDTQYYIQNESDAQSFRAQTQWVVDEKNKWDADPATGSNIAFVSHVGDVVNNGWNTWQWSQAVSAMSTLKNSSIPFGLARGNHDTWALKPTASNDTLPSTYGSTRFAENFGPSYFAGKSFYGGASTSGNSSFQTFTQSGRQYVTLHLDVNADATELAWAQGVINSHPDTPTIVSTHDYLTDSGIRGTGRAVPLTGRNTGEQLWQKFVKSNNEIFMVVNGHYHGQAEQLSFNDSGREVFEIMADYQSLQVNSQDNGKGFMRLMNFDPDAGRVSVRTFSPVLGRDLTTSDGMGSDIGKFAFNIDLSNRFNAAAPLVNEYHWNPGTSGNWSDAGNWTENAVPSAGLHSLNFGGASDYTATNNLLNGSTNDPFPVLVQSLNFDNTSGTVTLNGSSLITMRGGVGALATPEINVAAGSMAKVDAMISLASDTVANIDGELTITNNFRNLKTFTKRGAGVLILQGTVARFVSTKTVDVQEGSIRLGTGDSIYSQTPINIGASGMLDDSYGDGEGFSRMTGTGVYRGRHGKELQLGESDSTGTFDGRITAGTNGVTGATPAERNLVLRKTGVGTISLTNANSDFAGQTHILNGTLAVSQLPNRGTPSALGLGDVNNLGDAGVAAGADISIGDTAAAGAAILRYTGTTTSTNRNFAMTGNGGTIEVSTVGTELRLAGNVSGPGALVKSGLGTLTLTTSPTTGTINVSQGALAVDSSAGDLTLSQSVTGGGQFIKKGPGVLQISSGVTIDKATDLRVNEGVLRPAANSYPINSAGIVNIAGGATFDASYTDGLRIGGWGGDGTYISRAGSTGMNIGGGDVSATFAGKITAGTDGAVGGTNSARWMSWFNKTGAGTITLSSPDSDFSARVHIQQGTLSISNLTNRGLPSAAGVGGSGAQADLVVGSSTAATLQYTGPTALTDRRVEVGHTSGSFVDVTQPSTTLTVGTVSGSNSAAGLTKIGAGKLAVAGNASYTGATEVRQGVLEFAGTLATSSIFAKQGSSVVFANPSISRTVPVTLEAGARLTTRVAAGGQYAGIDSFSAASGGMVGTSGALLAGTHSGTAQADVTLQWRPRTTDELAAGASQLLSDVLDLNGTGSDIFVLSMGYDESTLGDVEESSLVLGWFSGSSWTSAVDGNVGGSSLWIAGAFADSGVVGLADDLGRYGVDTTTNTVWAVLNHNSSFGVTQAVPEPGSVGLIAVVAGGLLRRRR